MKRGRPLFILLILALGGALFLCAAAWKFSRSQPDRWQYITSNKGEVWDKFMLRFQTDPNLLEVNLEFKSADFEAIEAQRDLALAHGSGYQTHDDFSGYVPLLIVHDGDTAKAAVRLKGRFQGHWGADADKWSLRIKTKGKDSFMGMRNFSLQDASNRGRMGEWIFHEWLRYEGAIGIQIDFVDVVLNDENMGVYMIEQNMEPAIIKQNQRPDGPIIGFESDRYWEELDLEHPEKPKPDIFHREEIKIYNTTYNSANEIRKHNARVAAELLDDYRNGKLPVDSVFDIELMARFCAVVDLFGHLQHAARLSNLRFYYNPDSGLLEPVAYDQSYIHKWAGRLGTGKKLIGENAATGEQRSDIDFTNSLFDSEAFTAAYWQQLKRFAAPGYLEAFFADCKPRYDIAMKKVARDKPFFNLHEPQQLLVENAAAIHAYLPQSNAK